MTKRIEEQKRLYDFLNEEAMKRGISLSHMAQEIGVHHKTLTRTYETKPRIGTMSKIARYLDVNLLDLNKLPIRGDQ